MLKLKFVPTSCGMKRRAKNAESRGSRDVRNSDRPSSRSLGHPMTLRIPFETSSTLCKVEGAGLSVAMVRQTASLTITAFTEMGSMQNRGGDTFFVAIRGQSQVRAKVVDNENGTYHVSYKPSVSGSYRISISTPFGEPVPGSPSTVNAITPKPEAIKCELRGVSLTLAISASNSFEVRFRDALGQTAQQATRARCPARRWQGCSAQAGACL